MASAAPNPTLNQNASVQVDEGRDLMTFYCIGLPFHCRHHCTNLLLKLHEKC